MASTMLFVDDEADLQFMVAAYFECHGYQVVGVGNAEEARKCAGEKEFQVIVLDANLPGEGSGPLMDHLNQKYPGTPVIIYTGNEANDDHVKDLLARGAARHQLKDGSLEKLLNVVQEVTALAHK